MSSSLIATLDPLFLPYSHIAYLGSATNVVVSTAGGATPAVGDLLITVAAIKAETFKAAMTPPAGWTKRTTDVGASPNLQVWTRVAGASEPYDNIWAVTGDSTFVPVLLRGAGLPGFDVSSAVASGTSTSQAAAGVTPNREGITILAIALNGTGAQAGVDHTSPPGIFKTVAQGATNSSQYPEVTVFWKRNYSLGATGSLGTSSTGSFPWQAAALHIKAF